MGEKVIYQYKDKDYTIVQFTKVKFGGTWFDAVIYQCEYENADGQIWVREMKEFFNLFKRKQ